MIIINPSDIINNANINLINKNVYGSVKTTLHRVRRTEDKKADFSVEFNLKSIFGSDYADKDSVTFKKISAINLSSEIIKDDEILGYVTDLKTYISNKSIDTVKDAILGTINANTYKEVVFKKIRIELFKDKLSSTDINDVNISGLYKDSHYKWVGGSVPKQFNEIVSNRITPNFLTPRNKTVIEDFLEIKNKSSESFKDNQIGDIEHNMSQSSTDDKFVIELDIPIQYIEAKYDLLLVVKRVNATRGTAETLKIDFYNTTIENDEDEKESTVTLDSNSETLDIEDSELTQKGATLYDNELFVENAFTVIRNYKDGRQTIDLKCKIKEYADESEHLQIDPLNGETFKIGDVICPMMSKKGNIVPISTYSDGTRRVFKVSSSEVVYNKGYIYNEIKAKEVVPYVLTIDASQLSVYRDNEALKNGNYIYEGDTLRIYTSPYFSATVDNDKVIDKDSSFTVYVTKGVYIYSDEPGLYSEPGKLIYSWEQLIENGAVQVSGEDSPYLYKVSTENVGEIKISSELYRIATAAFQDCTYITSVYVPKSISDIGSRVFSGCDSLVNVYVDPKNTTYHSYGNSIIETSSNSLVAGCKASIIPDYVETISRMAFDGCTKLKEITIPNSVTTIGAYAFSACSELQRVTFGEGISTIEGYSFANCNNLLIYDFSNCNTIPTIVVDVFYNINSSCKIIVPDNLYDSWVQSWTQYSSYIVKASEV